MRDQFPASLPTTHREFIERALAVLPEDPRIVGIAAAGSFVTGNMDEFSDIDLLLVTAPGKQEEALRDRHAIAARLGDYIAGFTGEHVGEPRVLITLFDKPLLHVDLKFVALADAHKRVEEPAILWERDGELTAAFAQGKGIFPQPDIAWIEDRFWTWLHYGATKVARGELFEALDMIGFMRSTVLGPLALCRAGAKPHGVRRIEMHDPAFADALRATVASYDALDCLRALNVCVDLYRQLRAAIPGTVANQAAERAATRYAAEIERRVVSAPQ